MAWCGNVDEGSTRCLRLAVCIIISSLLFEVHVIQGQRVCSVAESPETRVLSSDFLAAGALDKTSISYWDFGGSRNPISAAAGQNVSLSCIVAVNVGVSVPTETTFLLPTAITLSDAAGLVMQSVSLSTDCETVFRYQEYVCSSLSPAGSLTIERGMVHFSSWRDNFTILRNVTLTCPSANTAAREPPCLLASAGTVQELLEAFTLYAAVVANVTIVITGNISITKGSWPDTPVKVHNNITLAGSSRLYRPVLDFNLMVNMWELVPGSNVVLINLTCANLAPTYFSPVFNPSIFTLLTERVWAFLRYQRQLHIINTTLVIPDEEYKYTRYWLTPLTSVVPESKAKAAWLSVINIQVQEVNDTGVYYTSVTSFTSSYQRVRLTNTLGSGYPLRAQETGLAQLLEDGVPLSAVRQVINGSDLRAALSPNITQPDASGRRWFLFVANFSLSDQNTATATAAMPMLGSTVFGRGPARQCVRLGLGGIVGFLTVPNRATLMVRQLVLGQLAVRNPAYVVTQPLDSLASPLWGVALLGGSSRIRLENCSLLVSARELALLQQALLPGDAAATLRAAGAPQFSSGLLSAVQAFFQLATDPLTVESYSTSNITVGVGLTQRYDMVDVTFRLPVPADGEEAVEVALPDAADPAPSPSSDDDGLAGWEIGVIVGCIVGGMLLLAALAAVVLVVRRRRRHRQAGASDSDKDQRVYEKYLYGSAEMAGRGSDARGGLGGGGAGSELTNPAQELTNSSQVLRPGARTSMDNAPTGGRPLKAESPTASASASVGLGNATGFHTSASTAGANSHGNSSSTGLPTGSGGSGLRQNAVRASAAISSAAASCPPQTGSGLVTDSFERAPSASVLGNNAAASGPSKAVTARDTASSTATPSGAMSSTPLFASGGAMALDQMHQMIHVLGRDFNDQQMEVFGLVGKGAHGTVYKGSWRGLPVAIKSMVFSSESSLRQQQRPLMEAAISANLVHPNIVTTYTYELREVEHEMAALSPELARQGGGWRLLIIQEYCDAGPLRRIVDCGFFLTPPRTSPTRPKPKRQILGMQRKDSAGATGSASSVSAGTPRGEAGAVAVALAAGGSSSGSSANPNNGSTATPSVAASMAGNEGAVAPAAPAGTISQVCSRLAASQAAGTHAGGPQAREGLDDVPPDVPPRPTNGLQAALRYVEAALMIARGLQHIHDKNIVHGDLNPNNVLLVRAPLSPLGFCLKVADFGLSVRMTEGESHMSNLFQGSPYYCAPEVVMSGKIGKPADIFSLGIMLWELQHGARPPWRMGVRLRSFPSLNTAELEFGAETPPRFSRLARDCFHASKDARPDIVYVANTLASIKAELESLQRS